MIKINPGKDAISEALVSDPAETIPPPQDNKLEEDSSQRSKRTAEEMETSVAPDEIESKRVKTNQIVSDESSGKDFQPYLVSAPPSSSQHGRDDHTGVAPTAESSKVSPPEDPCFSPPAVVEDIIHSRGHMTLSRGNPNDIQRWRAHRIAEDYINLSAQIMLPGTHLAPFGYDAPTGQYPVESISALSILTSPMRRPTVVEKWSPYEIAVFEAALSLVGKHFHKVQKFVKTKNTKEVVEFYYVWKKTVHYKVWKKQYISPEDDVDSDDD
jgi:hypothetical protein|eukprot:scaffold197_cov268-Chaetoceros_neogracile.AAC.71